MEEVEVVEIKEESISSGGIGFIVFGVILILGSLVALGFGFHKMLVYDEYLEVNTYVGNDQGNLILNGLYTISYFILFGVGFISGLLSIAISKLSKRVHG